MHNPLLEHSDNTIIHTFHWHVFGIRLCMTQFLLFLFLRFLFLLHSWQFLHSNKNYPKNVNDSLSPQWMSHYNEIIINKLTFTGEKLRTFMSSLTQILATSLVDTSFFKPLFNSAEEKGDKIHKYETNIHTHPQQLAKNDTVPPQHKSTCENRLSALQLKPYPYLICSSSLWRSE